MASVNTLCKSVLNVKNTVIKNCNLYSDKGKYKGTRCPMDICSEPTVVERRAAAETKKIIQNSITQNKSDMVN